MHRGCDGRTTTVCWPCLGESSVATCPPGVVVFLVQWMGWDVGGVRLREGLLGNYRFHGNYLLTVR